MLDMSKLLQNKARPAPEKKTPPPPPESEATGHPTGEERLAELKDEERKVSAEVEALEAELERAHKAGDMTNVRRLRLARRELWDRAADLARDIPLAEQALIAALYAVDRRQLVADVEALTAQHRDVLPDIEAFMAAAVPLYERLEAMHWEGHRLTQRLQTYEAKTDERLEGVQSTERLWRARPGLAGPIGIIARTWQAMLEYRAWLGNYPDAAAKREADYRATQRRDDHEFAIAHGDKSQQPPRNSGAVTWWSGTPAA